MKKVLFACIFIGIGAVISWFTFSFIHRKQPAIISPVAKPKPLEKYTFSNLHAEKLKSGKITLGPVFQTTDDHQTQMFSFTDSVAGKKVSGVITMPTKPGNYPIIVMFRGYVDREKYQPGIGTQPSANVFASNGFITLAPDFLGYGYSASGATDPLEDRFQTYTTALSLLHSLGNLNQALSASYSGTITADPKRVGVWAHSNGGQIALSVMEIGGFSYPTVLWAPVSSSFPYDILYYIDEYDDHGKGLIKLVAKFEDTYDAEKYSLTNYFNWIKAPVLVLQGTSDEEVPAVWSENLVNTLKKDGIDATLIEYPGENHNFLNGSFPDAIQKSLEFYQEKLP